MSRGKNDTEPGKNSVAGAGPLGRSGLGGSGRDAERAWMGSGAGPSRGGEVGGAGGRACSSIKRA